MIRDHFYIRCFFVCLNVLCKSPAQCPGNHINIKIQVRETQLSFLKIKNTDFRVHKRFWIDSTGKWALYIFRTSVVCSTCFVVQQGCPTSKWQGATSPMAAPVGAACLMGHARAGPWPLPTSHWITCPRLTISLHAAPMAPPPTPLRVRAESNSWRKGKARDSRWCCCWSTGGARNYNLTPHRLPGRQACSTKTLASLIWACW